MRPKPLIPTRTVMTGGSLPRLWGGENLPPDVAMQHPRLDPPLAQAPGELVGDDDAAVPSAGAADGDREVRLALGPEAGEHHVEEPLQGLEELPRLRVVEDVAANRLVATGLRAQLVDPVRV